MPQDFDGAFTALRSVLMSHASGMVVQTDTPQRVELITPAIAPSGRPFFFGAVMRMKSAVTYHLYPLYFNPALQSHIPPALQKRKQGKTCFNFQRPDDGLFQELDALTREARAHWERHGFLEPGPVTPARLDAALRAGGEDPEAIARLRKSKGRAAAKKRAATLARKSSRQTQPRTHTAKQRTTAKQPPLSARAATIQGDVSVGQLPISSSPPSCMSGP